MGYFFILGFGWGDEAKVGKLFLLSFLFETGSHYVAQAALELFLAQINEVDLWLPFLNLSFKTVTHPPAYSYFYNRPLGPYHSLNITNEFGICSFSKTIFKT